MKRLLLHICCGPCATPIIPNLNSEFEVAGFYYNPNIFPETEFENRLASAKKVAEFNGIQLIVPKLPGVIPAPDRVEGKAPTGIYVGKGLDSRLRGNDKESGNDNGYESYLDFIGETKKKPERCLLCYRKRLAKAAEYASENNFEYFSTTLLISPFQYHTELKIIGEEIAHKFGIKFSYQDFRPLYGESREISKAMNLYLQKYCGCKFSRKRK